MEEPLEGRFDVDFPIQDLIQGHENLEIWDARADHLDD
jgi:hypothetical protein